MTEKGLQDLRPNSEITEYVTEGCRYFLILIHVQLVQFVNCTLTCIH